MDISWMEVAFPQRAIAQSGSTFVRTSPSHLAAELTQPLTEHMAPTVMPKSVPFMHPTL